MFFPDIDPRIAKWGLMESATRTALIVLSYLVFVKIIGPLWMRNRKPYDLRVPMILYNFAMVVFSAWMFYKFGKHGWFRKYSWVCEPVTYFEDEDSMGMVEVCWYFFISKIVELVDTVFFVLRKKYTHISALHVIHHAAVPLTARYAISRGASGYNTFFGFLNTFIHIWMYLYYALSALGPWTHKYLWWKKYLTTLQMIQFCIVFTSMVVHCALPGCEVNPILILVSLGQAVFFFVLFVNFYLTSYKKKTKQKKQIDEQRASSAQNGGTRPQKHGDDLLHVKQRSGVRQTTRDNGLR